MSELPSIFILCLTLLHESADQGEWGMRRVASVIYCSAESIESADLAAECLKKGRYKCWTGGSPSVAHMRKWNSYPGSPDARAYEIALKISREMVSQTFKPVISARYYCRKDRVPWLWQQVFIRVEVYLDHVFFDEKA